MSFRFGGTDYEIDKAIAQYEGFPFLGKKKCDCWDGYKRVPGTEPCAPGSCEKCDSHSKKSSQGDKPSPNSAMAVFDALCNGSQDEATELLGHTDCPEGCEVHAEGKCNHGYMSAGRTRVRYLVGSEPFGKGDESKSPVV